MPIRVVAKHIIKEDRLDDFIRLGKKLVESTNKEDRGCISYQVYQDIDNPCVVAMLEEWENQEAIDNHLSAKHFQDILPELEECLAGPSDFNNFKLL
ncbi:MAG: antibiotic biosynthesis monooxygenase [Oscillospiraceae bacterium]|nr:antibiotic biosynthesis monooxygenase [Oscillospiraceae bacterium]